MQPRADSKPTFRRLRPREESVLPRIGTTKLWYVTDSIHTLLPRPTQHPTLGAAECARLRTQKRRKESGPSRFGRPGQTAVAASEDRRNAVIFDTRLPGSLLDWSLSFLLAALIHRILIKWNEATSSRTFPLGRELRLG